MVVVFQYFADTLEAVTAEARRDGRWDAGILDLGTGCASVEKEETRVFLGRAEAGSHRVELHTVRVERGLNWDEAWDIYLDHSEEGDGFYLSAAQPPSVALVVGAGRKALGTAARLYNLYRPNTGVQHALENLESVRKRGLKWVPAEDAKGVRSLTIRLHSLLITHRRVL